MNPSAVGHTRLVIVRATGMVSGYALRYALDLPAVNGHQRQEAWHITSQAG
jgi:hypothetical protein